LAREKLAGGWENNGRIGDLQPVHPENACQWPKWAWQRGIHLVPSTFPGLSDAAKSFPVQVS